MHLFGASSFATARDSLLLASLKDAKISDILGLHLFEHSGESPHKLVQSQFRFQLPSHSIQQFNIVFWHDVINNSVTAHPSKYNHTLQPQELVSTLRTLLSVIAGVVYCRRSGSSAIFNLINESFFKIHAVNHLLSRRQLKSVCHSQIQCSPPRHPFAASPVLLNFSPSPQSLQVQTEEKQLNNRRS